MERLKKAQREMIEKMLYPSDSNPFHIAGKNKMILNKVLLNGFYLEEDKEVLNHLRECYLNSNNWVKFYPKLK